MSWSSLPFYQKIRIEGPKLTEKHAAYLNKICAKSIVRALVPGIKVANLVKTFSNPSDFLETDICTNHILKASRGSGYVLDLANAKSVIPTLDRWKSELERAGLPVEFLIEEKINDAVYGTTGNAIDYKFFCFHGKPHFFLVRFGKNRHFYYLDHTPIKKEGSGILPRVDLAHMIDAATKLSAPFPFVRIDLYNGVDGVYFGEYTFHVRAGHMEFSPDLEFRFGKLWKS
jgi:hypothetical protein